MKRMRMAVVLLGIALWFAATSATGDERDKPDPLKGLELRNIGPAMTSGRIADIAIHPTDQNTWYVAVGSGGVWKTTNAGVTWKAIFEHEGSYSIGCVAIDPNHPEIVWVGTGENVSGRHVGYGDGVYRSLDGGATWTRLGLEHSEHIGRILVDPRNSNTVFVASQGPLWSSGGDRGLFKTSDGGATWQNVLAGGPYTGVNDVLMDPRTPDLLYATTYQHLRTVAALIDGGPESAIHKSTDGGKTWRKLKKGLPDEEMGRIGLALSPQDPDVVYATIELAHQKGGFYRSADAGGTWETMNDAIAGGTGPHYYQEIFASPHRFDRVYMTDVRLKVTEDGGKTFKDIEGRFKHVDNHAIAFDPKDPDYLLVGCDGGLYETHDLAVTWRFVSNLPVTQFYKVAVDDDAPFYNVYGGAQDNNTLGGPSRTDNIHGIRNSDWFVAYGGDGYQPAVDPTQPNIVYAQLQNGTLVRFDRKTGENVFIQPQPVKDEPTERFNWDAPIVISPHDPATLYYASQRVWRSDDRGNSWRPISGDLTRALDRLKLPMMGRVWSFDALWDLYAMSKYGSITSLDQSLLDANLVYAGTDDGLIQVTEDGGAHWRRIDRLPGVPEFFFVNDIKADLHDRNTVYVAVDQHKAGNFAPYLLKSTDRGKSWKSIAGGLPARAIVWRVVQDHVKPGLLFAGTEFGLFFSTTGGSAWTQLKGGVPNIPFRDLAIQRRENDLVGASFGRGVFILDDYSPLRDVSPAMLTRDVALFPVRKAWWYMPRRVMGGGEKGSQGDGFFTAPNPPFGAVFTYYLKNEIKTRKGARRASEKEIEKQGGNTPYPGWDALRAEEREEDPGIVLTVRDAGGNVVRRLAGPVKAGFQRVAWDLRGPSVEPEGEAPAGGGGRERRGRMAPPGTYMVSVAKRQEGVLTDLGPSQTFEVVRMRSGTLPGAPIDEVAAFWRDLSDLDRGIQGARAAIDENLGRMKAIRDALMRSTVGDATLDDQARAFERRLRDLKEKLIGNPTRDDRYNESGPVGITDRLRPVTSGVDASTYGPTPTHRASLDIVKQTFAELRRDLDQLIDTDLPAFDQRLNAAGVPWTGGRGVPGGR